VKLHPVDVHDCLVVELPRGYPQALTTANGLEEKGIMTIGLCERCHETPERHQYDHRLLGTHVTPGTHGINVIGLSLEAMLHFQ